MQRIEHLLNILDTIKRHGDPTAAEWFSAAFDEYMTGRGKKPLEDVLGLKSTRGHRKVRTRYQEAKRNEYIRQAFEIISPDKRDCPRCDDLAQQISDFEARIYPRWLKNGGPPENASQLRTLLYHAKRTGQLNSPSWKTVWRWVFVEQ